MRFNLEDYETVDARLERFWKEHPGGRVETRLLTDPRDLQEVVFWAAVWFDVAEEHPRATGTAFERPGSGANQTSHLENAETSAIGRALANAGYKASKKAPRPSREEMGKTQGPPYGSSPAATPAPPARPAAPAPPSAPTAVERAVAGTERPPSSMVSGGPESSGDRQANAAGEKCGHCHAPAGKPHTPRCPERQAA